LQLPYIKTHYLALASKAAEQQCSRAVIATLGDMVRETGDDDPGPGLDGPCDMDACEDADN